jgi:hypothetical protein
MLSNLSHTKLEGVVRRNNGWLPYRGAIVVVARRRSTSYPASSHPLADLIRVQIVPGTTIPVQLIKQVNPDFILEDSYNFIFFYILFSMSLKAF